MRPTVEMMAEAWQYGQRLVPGSQISLPLPRPDPPGVQFFTYQRLAEVAEEELATPGDWLTGPGALFFSPADTATRPPAPESWSPFHVFVALGWDDEAEEDAEDAETELCGLYDTLLPAFFAGQPAAAPAATRFLALFARLTPAPLRPYYEQYGAAFLAWLRQAAVTEEL